MTDNPTPKRFDDAEIAALLNAITLGEWCWEDEDTLASADPTVVGGAVLWAIDDYEQAASIMCTSEDRNFIAAAPAIIRQLLSERAARDIQQTMFCAAGPQCSAIASMMWSGKWYCKAHVPDGGQEFADVPALRAEIARLRAENWKLALACEEQIARALELEQEVSRYRNALESNGIIVKRLPDAESFGRESEAER